MKLTECNTVQTPTKNKTFKKIAHPKLTETLIGHFKFQTLRNVIIDSPVPFNRLILLDGLELPPNNTLPLKNNFSPFLATYYRTSPLCHSGPNVLFIQELFGTPVPFKTCLVYQEEIV